MVNNEDRNSAEYWLIVGVDYSAAGLHAEAIEAYQQAIKINPYYTIAYHNLGITYGNLGRHSESIDAFKEAIKIDPCFAEAHGNLGVAYEKLGKLSEAAEKAKGVRS